MTSQQAIEEAGDRLTDILYRYFNNVLEYGDVSLPLLDKIDLIDSHLSIRKSLDETIINSIENRY